MNSRRPGAGLDRQHRLRGVQGGRRPPCSGCVVVSPASVALAWRPLHARRARSFMISTLRSQVGFAAAVAHAHLRVHSQLTYPGIKDRDPCAFRAWRVVPYTRERGGLLQVSSLGGGVIRIRILMYPACILQDTHILMYLDVSQTYLKCSVKFQENTCILTFCMYFTRISNESKIHFGYT